MKVFASILNRRFPNHGRYGIIPHKGGYAMLNFEERRLVGLLLNVCSMSKPCVLAWLEVPGFSDAITSEIRSGGFIDNRFLFELASRMYEDIISNPGLYVDVKLQNCRRGLNQLRRAVDNQVKQPIG